MKAEHCAGGCNDDLVDSFISELRCLFENLLVLEAVNGKYATEESRLSSEKARYEREAASSRSEAVQLNQRREMARVAREAEEIAHRRAEQSYLVLEENLRIAVKLKVEKVFSQYCEDQQSFFQRVAEESGQQTVASI